MDKKQQPRVKQTRNTNMTAMPSMSTSLQHSLVMSGKHTVAKRWYQNAGNFGWLQTNWGRETHHSELCEPRDFGFEADV